MKLKLLILLLFIGQSLAFGQLTMTSCNTFKTYEDFKNDQSNYKHVDLLYPVEAQAATQQEAINNAKVKAISVLVYGGTQQLNPLMDSVWIRFVNDIIQLSPRDFKLRRRRGKFKCTIYSVEYNKPLADFVKERVDDFVHYQIAFDTSLVKITHPDLTPLTKNLYKSAIERLQLLFTSARMRFDNVKEVGMLETRHLDSFQRGYNPCVNGYKHWASGNKYADYVRAIRQNYDLDYLIFVESISTNPTPDGKCKVTIIIKGFDVNNAAIALNYKVEQTFDNNISPYECVQQSLASDIFDKNAEAIINQMIERFANFVKGGADIQLQICQNVFPSRQARQQFEYTLYRCKAMRISQSNDWRLKGTDQKVGYKYTGRKYLNDFETKMLIEGLLDQVGARNYEINVTGQIITITPIVNKTTNTQSNSDSTKTN